MRCCLALASCPSNAISARLGLPSRRQDDPGRRSGPGDRGRQRRPPGRGCPGHRRGLHQAQSRSRTSSGPIPAGRLNDLLALRLVERIQPVTDTGRSRRKIYRIADNFLAFYLGTLVPGAPRDRPGLGRDRAAGAIDPQRPSGRAWEEAFRDHLRLAADIHQGGQSAMIFLTDSAPRSSSSSVSDQKRCADLVTVRWADWSRPSPSRSSPSFARRPLSPFKIHYFRDRERPGDRFRARRYDGGSSASRSSQCLGPLFRGRRHLRWLT